MSDDAALENLDDLQAWRMGNELAVPFEEALDAWAVAAHAALSDLSRRFGNYITNAELAARAQADVGIATREPVRLWIVALQRRITAQCREADEPPLVSLMVGHDQKVGPGYEEAVVAAGLPVPADINEHAAAARFACYLHFGARIPAGAGPQLPPKVEQIRRAEAARKAKAHSVSSGRVVQRRAAATSRPTAQRKAEPAPPKLCPTCFTELSVSGRCDYC